MSMLIIMFAAFSRMKQKHNMYLHKEVTLELFLILQSLV